MCAVSYITQPSSDFCHSYPVKLGLSLKEYYYLIKKMNSTFTSTTTSTSTKRKAAASLGPTPRSTKRNVTDSVRMADVSTPQVDCDVCMDSFNDSSLSVVKCMHCDVVTCVECTKQYLLSQLTSACMKCKRTWDEMFLRTMLPLKWVKGEYATYRKKILVDIEKSLMPATVDYCFAFQNWMKEQAIAEQLKKQSQSDVKRLKAKLDTATQDFEQAYAAGCFSFDKYDPQDVQSKWDNKLTIAKQLKDVRHDAFVATVRAGLFKMNYTEEFQHWNKGEEYIAVRTRQERNFQVNISLHPLVAADSAAAIQAQEGVATSVRHTSTEQRVTHKPCIREGCRGFIRGVDGVCKCDLCHLQACAECGCELVEEHRCDPTVVASVKAIERSTKPCPNCAVPIFRTEGCDHMWCVQCNTGFSWRTNQRIADSVNTNPYFRRYQQTLEAALPAQPRLSPGGAGCLYIPRQTHQMISQIREAFEPYLVHPSMLQGPDSLPVYSWITASFMMFEQLFLAMKSFSSLFACLPPQRPRDWSPLHNRATRVKWLCKHLDDKQLHIQTMANYKQIAYLQQLYDLCDTLKTLVTDWMNRVLAEFAEGIKARQYEVWWKVYRKMEVCETLLLQFPNWPRIPYENQEEVVFPQRPYTFYAGTKALVIETATQEEELNMVVKRAVSSKVVSLPGHEIARQARLDSSDLYKLYVAPLNKLIRETEKDYKHATSSFLFMECVMHAEERWYKELDALFWFFNKQSVKLAQMFDYQPMVVVKFNLISDRIHETSEEKETNRIGLPAGKFEYEFTMLNKSFETDITSEGVLDFHNPKGHKMSEKKMYHPDHTFVSRNPFGSLFTV